MLRWGALIFLIALPGVMAHARARHTEAWAKDHFATAEHMREALNGRPPAERTRRDYQRVLNAYRLVYMGLPTSTKADPSVVAVAETLVEMGRRFNDDKVLKSAISQYKFLRREYPGSKYRFDALFTIGEIYKDDLDDPSSARATFQDFLHRYPHNRLADGARGAIVELNQQAKNGETKTRETKPAKKSSGDAAVAKNKAKDAGAKDKLRVQDDVKEADTGKDDGDENASESATDDTAAADVPQASSSKTVSADTSHHPGTLPRVTGIRHWSTPDYTRVAIDLEDQVVFGSKRISHPDRIFFDLRDTKLASTLVGKSFDVDDGFLKKIRVAQYQPGRTRVVLEVDDLSDYNAFLLPDPYRLIIDIHGKKAHGKQLSARNFHAKPSKDADEPVKTDVEDSAPATDSGAEANADATTLATMSTASLKTVAKPVKKVVVEADAPDAGHDASPVRPAKLEGSGAASNPTDTPAPVVRKIVDDSDTTSESTPAANSHAAKGRTHSKNSARLAKDDKVAPDTIAPDIEVREASPTARGDRSLIRALGLKIGRIVIDPGHGGHDTGTIGPDGLQEKDLVLDVGRRLGKMLETRLGAEVVYTRKNDTFIPLETRTAIANQQRADLFISIHANSSHDPNARGVETYYLNFTSSPEALEVAARENAVSEKSIYELQDLVKKIALKEKIEESREFASDVQESLHSGLAARSPAIRDRGVKKAPFIVLIGANMPSILAEISFVSNPADEHRLETSEYRQHIADSLYRGVARYANGLSGVKVASKIDRAADSKP
jgi:N-acetylmuramoyl-L-alanine amidase